MTRKPYLYLLPAVAALSLVACGGGGGGDTPPPAEPTSINANLSGKAAKGIIIRGRVVASELNADGSVKNANVGETTTDDNGRYQLTTNNSYEGGPIEITVSRADDTLMVCDALSGCGNSADPSGPNGPTIDFGERYNPASLNMTAMLPSVANGATVSAQVTPFTHMAAKRARQVAQAGGTLNAATVATANQAVSNLLGGLNILAIEPVDVTDDSAVNGVSATDDRVITYASLVAAIAELADDDANGAPDLEKVLDDLALDDSGSFSASTLGAISDKAKLTRQQTPKPDDLSGSFTKIDDSVTLAQNSGGSITPVTGFAGDSNLDKAYAFMADLRTWGTVIGNEARNPARAFETQIDLSERAADSFNGSLSDALGAAASAIGDFMDGVLVLTDDQLVYTNADGSFTSGTLVKTVGTLVDTYTISNAVFESTGAAPDTTITSIIMTAPKSATIIADIPLTMGITSIDASDSYARLVARSGSVTLVMGANYDLDLEALGPLPSPNLKSVAFDLDASITQLQTLNAQNELGTANDPVTFTGEVSFTVYPVLDGNNEMLDGVPGSLRLAGTISSQSGQQLSMEFVASVPNAANIQPINSPLNLDSSYASNNDDGDGVEELDEHWAFYEISGNTFSASSKAPFTSQTTATYNEGNRSVDVTSTAFGGGTVNDTNGVSGYDNIGHWLSFNSWAISPPMFSFYVPGQGQYELQMHLSSTGGATGFYAYTLVEPDVEFNLDAAAASVGLTFGAQFAGVPEATFNIIADKAAARDTGEVSLTISYGARSIVFDVSGNPVQGNPDFDEGTASVTITNSDGVILVLSGTAVGSANGDDISGSLTIDGIEIATVDTVNGITKVTYIDGTFEIF